MSSISGTMVGGGGPSTVYFGERSRVSGGEYLVAVVIWRQRLTRAPWSWRDTLRNIRSIIRPGRPPRPPSQLPAGWSSRSAGGDGEREVLLSRERGLLGVLGQYHALPDGEQTLVLLIDEPAGPESARAVSSFTLQLPPQPRLTPDRERSSAENARRMAEQFQRRSNSWEALIDAEPRIRSFRDPGSDRQPPPEWRMTYEILYRGQLIGHSDLDNFGMPAVRGHMHGAFRPSAAFAAVEDELRLYGRADVLDQIDGTFQWCLTTPRGRTPLPPLPLEVRDAAGRPLPGLFVRLEPPEDSPRERARAQLPPAQFADDDAFVGDSPQWRYEGWRVSGVWPAEIQAAVADT